MPVWRVNSCIDGRTTCPFTRLRSRYRGQLAKSTRPAGAPAKGPALESEEHASRIGASASSPRTPPAPRRNVRREYGRADWGSIVGFVMASWQPGRPMQVSAPCRPTLPGLGQGLRTAGTQHLEPRGRDADQEEHRSPDVDLRRDAETGGAVYPRGERV